MNAKFFAYKGFNHGILAKSLGNWEPGKKFLNDICEDFQKNFGFDALYDNKLVKKKKKFF